MRSRHEDLPRRHEDTKKTNRDFLWSVAVVISLASALALAQGRTHELRLLPQNVHWGYYDPALKPVLRIASGDTVRVETMIARGLARLRAAGVKEDEIPESLKVVERISPSADPARIR